MPAVLQEKNWECPAAVELTQWTAILNEGKARQSSIPAELNTIKGHDLLKRITEVRHTAVHRISTSARGVSQLLESAVKLTQILGDSIRAAQLEELFLDVKSKIKAMELNKYVLEDMASTELQEIQQKRAELDRIEADIIRKTLEEDKSHRILVGQLLEESVGEIFNQEKEIKNN